MSFLRHQIILRKANALSSFVEFETAADLKTAVEKLDGREFKGARVTCVADVCIQFIPIWPLLTQFRPNRIPLVIEPDPALLLADLMRRTMSVVAHPVDTALVVTDTAIGAHLDGAIMTMTVVVMAALPHGLAPRLMTILLHVVAVLKILTGATTHLLTHMPMAMADPLTTDLLQGITLREIPVTPIMIAVVATGNLSYLNKPPYPPTYIDRSCWTNDTLSCNGNGGRLCIGRFK